MSSQLGAGRENIATGIGVGGEDLNKLNHLLLFGEVILMKNKKIAAFISWVAIILGFIVIVLVLYKVIKGL